MATSTKHRVNGSHKSLSNGPAKRRARARFEFSDPTKETYSAFVCKTFGEFHRRSPKSVPKHWKPQKFGSGRMTKEGCQEWAEAYNRRAMRQGWSTWAVIWKDKDLELFQKEIKRASFNYGAHRDSKKPHLFLHVLRFWPDGKGEYYLQMSLTAPGAKGMHSMIRQRTCVLD